MNAKRPANVDRGARALSALARYNGDPYACADTCLTDLLTDTIHAIGADRVADALRVAEMHAEAEERPDDLQRDFERLDR